MRRGRRIEKVLVMSDSRGKGLEDLLYERDGGREWRVIVSRGKGLHDLVYHAVKMAYRERYDTIIFMGGICNVTVKNRENREIIVRPMERRFLVHSLISEIQPAVEMLRTLTGRVIFATTYGVELERYNRHVYGKSVNPITEMDNQIKVDQTVDILNRELAKVNNQWRQPTIRLSNGIHHRRKNGSICTSYRLLRDGCHPGRELLRDHAEMIIYRL